MRIVGLIMWLVAVYMAIRCILLHCDGQADRALLSMVVAIWCGLVGHNMEVMHHLRKDDG